MLVRQRAIATTSALLLAGCAGNDLNVVTGNRFVVTNGCGETVSVTFRVSDSPGTALDDLIYLDANAVTIFENVEDEDPRGHFAVGVDVDDRWRYGISSHLFTDDFNGRPIGHGYFEYELVVADKMCPPK